MSLNVATSAQTANPLLEEQALLSGLRAGEERAFETLVREQTRRLLPMARRFLGSSEDARDAVQETLLAAIQSLPTFRGEARLSTWIRHIGVNQCLMILRKRRRHPEVDIENAQHLQALKARLRLDGKGRTSLHAGVFPGSRFTSGWNNTGWALGILDWGSTSSSSI